MSDFLSRWTGLLLCGIGVIATLALAAAGDLTLYIHPRYVVFTVALVVIGAVLLCLSVWFAATGRDHRHAHDGEGHGHDHDHDHSTRPSAWRRAGLLGGGAVVVVAALALLVAPPTTLSADRALTSAAATDGGGDVPAPVLVGSDPTRFSVRDWATILGSGSTATDLVGQRADVTGILLLDDGGGARIGRYAVTCCTVDAQLFAVPLDDGQLRSGLASGTWVRITGSFADADGVTRLVPDAVEEVTEPDDPYLS